MDFRDPYEEDGIADWWKRSAWWSKSLVAVFAATPDTSLCVFGLHDNGDTASSVADRLSFSGSSAASGIVAQYRLRTCLRAGRRIGLGKKKSIPESMHSFTLLSSAKAVRATIGAE